jgi:predicted small secreted protein
LFEEDAPLHQTVKRLATNTIQILSKYKKAMMPISGTHIAMKREGGLFFDYCKRNREMKMETGSTCIRSGE